MMMRLATNTTNLIGRTGAHSGTLMNSAEDLIARVRAGDDDAFRLLFERYARPIFRFIYSMTGRMDLAEELSQETFLAAYKSIRSLRNESKIGPWLYGIARNVTRKSLRSRRGVAETSITEGLAAEVPPDAMRANTHQLSPDLYLLSKEQHEAVLGALIRLDEDKRLAFTLKVMQQKSYQEISEITGSSVAKLKTDVRRARLEMRSMLHFLMEVSDEV
jgi:RNA polymerase sigma-70 factor (ECF subfamily)